jgi:hypothetical protein
MNRRTIITILIAVIVAVVIGLLWLWFFGSAGTAPTQTGSFGTTTNRTVSTTQTGGTPTNIPGQVGQTAGSNGGTLAGGGYGGVYTPGGTGVSATSTAPGVNWLSGGGTNLGITGGSGTTFNPAAINQLNNGSVGGQVNVLGSYNNPSGGGGSNNGLAAGLIAGTAVACTSFLVQGQVTSLLPSIGFVKTTDTTNASKNFMDCLARTIARAAVQQITNSVINWINSGFNGSPSFVTNYQQFFNNVADQAAGSFIQNYTNFAPYCTPFAKQIQIALAQSYARRNTAQSCSLSSLLGGTGISLFGKTAAGTSGWGNLVSFTTNPSNNPYGAYMSAQGQLQGALAQAAQNANRNISPGGFLNFQQPYNCKPSTTGGQPVCQYKITTPGSIIQDSLSKTLGVSQDTLTQAGISGSFDAIISALISQLMTRALQGGVSNLSGQNGYSSYYLTADQQAAQDQGQALLTQLQGLVVVAQQYGQSEQGSIQDIQNAQSQLNTLANCWQGAATQSTLSATQQNIAASNATSTLNTISSFDTQVTSLNAQITRANTAIATLQDLQTKTLGVASTADVTAVKTALSADDAQGLLIAQADVTQAQQDRSTLQAQLSSLNTSTAAGLQQCYAFH